MFHKKTSPHHLYKMTLVKVITSAEKDYLYPIACVFVVLNSSVNVVIYGIFDMQFRHSIHIRSVSAQLLFSTSRVFLVAQYLFLSIFVQNCPKVYNMICDYFNFFLHFSIAYIKSFHDMYHKFY